MVASTCHSTTQGKQLIGPRERRFYEHLVREETDFQLTDRLASQMKRLRHPRLSEQGRAKRYAEMEIYIAELRRRHLDAATRPRCTQVADILPALQASAMTMAALLRREQGAGGRHLWVVK